MRIARYLTLFALTAMAALAFATSAAAAVEITEEETPPDPTHHCAAVTLSTSGHDAEGGCQLSASSDAPIQLEAFGALASACDNLYDAAIDENGHGFIYNQVLTGEDCTTPPCTIGTAPNVESAPWEINVSEGEADEFLLEAKFCVQSPSLGTVNCHIENVVIDTADHTPIEFILNALPCENLPFIHVTGNYTAVPDYTDGIEINHG